MLCSCVCSSDQVKCCKYWPDDSEMYGDIKITLLKTESLAEYTVRTFALERVSPHLASGQQENTVVVQLYLLQLLL